MFKKTHLHKQYKIIGLFSTSKNSAGIHCTRNQVLTCTEKKNCIKTFQLSIEQTFKVIRKLKRSENKVRTYLKDTF